MQTVHFRNTRFPPVNYLEKDEMKALLEAPDRHDTQGLRDYALLLFLYNTGARASEASRLTVGDLDLVSPAATLHGKGRKVRQCPLWKVTADALRPIIANRINSQGVFLNRYGQSLTRYGIHILVKRYARRAAVKAPTLRTKRVGPHSIRHYVDRRNMPNASMLGYRMAQPARAIFYLERSSVRHSPDEFRGS